MKLEEIQILGEMLPIVHFEYRPVNFTNAENQDICRRESFPEVLFQCEIWSLSVREQQNYICYKKSCKANIYT
jgi:hypothetical protein